MAFSRFNLATCSQVEAPVASLHRMIRDSLRNLLVSGLLNHEKHLDKFFKNFVKRFWLLILATCSQLILVGKITCFTQIELNPRQFSKTFQFSLTSRPHTLSCPPLPLPKPPFSLAKLPFSSSILYQFSRKGTHFLLFSKYFKFLALVFLDFVFMMRYKNMMIVYGFVDVLLSLIYGFCWFCKYNAYSTCCTCLCFIFMHCFMFCVVLCISCS